LLLRRDLDGAREKQQLFSQRGFARVRVRNDREGAAAVEFGE
jgi:Flp pilus assembly protein TadG